MWYDSIMARRYVTKKLTFMGNVMWLLLVGILLMLLALAIPPLSDAVGSAFVWVFFVPPLIVAIALAQWNKHLLKKRNEQIMAFATQRGLKIEPDGSTNMFTKLGAIDELSEVRDKKIRNVVHGNDWEYYDFSYNVYARYRANNYKAATIHYGVMATTLPRSLPNVFFDSIKARHRQFRFHFARSQRHSLEGDFDKHFATYFPPDYTIDSMSFISPDVMWKLREARDYDIEIVGDQLFLYGPLYDPELQITDMANKITAIKKELLDNIMSYRDDRLPYAEGRKKTALQGASLKLSTFWAKVTLAIAVLYFIGRLIELIISD